MRKPVKLKQFREYISKPKHVLAIQFRDNNLPQGVEVDAVGEFRIKTNHGFVGIEAGDWVIKTEAGEYYPCSDKEFKKIYKEC